jgi:hypothetical protein
MPSSLLTGLIAYYKMDGNSNDSTGNGHNGSDTNVTYSSSGAIINQAAQFNSSYTSYITVPHNSALNIEGGDSTISFWEYFQTGGQYMLEKGLYSSGTYWGVLHLSGGGTIQVVFGTANDTNDDYIRTNTIYGAGTLRHILATHSDAGRTIKVYANGVLDTATTQLIGAGSISPSNTNPLLIGAQEFSGGTPTQNFYGALDEMGFWNRVLTSAEISALYNGGAGLQYPFSTGVPANPAFILNFL